MKMKMKKISKIADRRWKMGRLFVYDYGYVYESFGLWMKNRE